MFRRAAPNALLLDLALNGCCMHTKQAIDVLWPELTVSEGRDRLRKLLCRLPSQCGGLRLVWREGDTLVLRAHTDLADYEWALATMLTYAGQ